MWPDDDKHKCRRSTSYQRVVVRRQTGINWKYQRFQRASRLWQSAAGRKAPPARQNKLDGDSFFLLSIIKKLDQTSNPKHPQTDSMP